MFIYQLPISLYSFKLRLAIALKGATLELRTPPGGTYRSAEFRAINPAGTIPTLIDDDFTLTESDAIIEYLDDMNVGAALLPADPQQRARARMMSRWCDMRLEPAVRALFAMVKPDSRNPESIAAADARIAAALDLLEQALDDEGPYALGARAGLPDCGLTASLVWLAEFSGPLKLTAQPGHKVSRTLAAMNANDTVAGEIGSYRTLAADWIKSRT